MAKREGQTKIRPEGRTVAPLGVIFLCCGGGGKILAADGIKFSRLKLPDANQGKIIKVSTTDGYIKIDNVGDDMKHTTLIGLDKKRGAIDELHIGVSFFKTDVPADAPAGYKAKAFLFQTSDGYNIVPKFLPLKPKGDPHHDGQQGVNELALITTHVPPRRLHINDRDTEPIPPLSAQDEQTLQTVSDLPKLPDSSNH